MVPIKGVFMRLALTFIVLISLGLTACGGKSTLREEPDWVNGVSGRYPAVSFLTGRGEGRNLDEAKDRARSDLVKTLEVEVSAKSKDVVSFSSTTKDEETRAETVSTITREIRTSTQKVVKGVEIGDVWMDPRTGNHYALAIWSRLKAGSALEAEIKQRDDATGLQMRAAESQADPMLRLAHLNRAAQEQRVRNQLQSTLQVVDSTGRGIQPDYPLGKIMALMDVSMANIKIDAVGAGVNAAQLQSILSGALSKAGFSAAGASAAFHLHGEYVQENRELREGWIWLRGTVTLKLVDASGAVRGTHRVAVKVSAQEDAVATARVMDKITVILNDSLKDILLGFFPT